MEVKIQNCAYEFHKKSPLLTVAVHDPNQPDDFFELETDLRFHYANIHFRLPRKGQQPLLKKIILTRVGPEDYKINFRVNGSDAPALQLSLERTETVLSRIHTEYQQYLHSQYRQYAGEFKVSKTYEDGATRYEAESELNRDQLIPQPRVADFTHPTSHKPLDGLDRIDASNEAYEYIKYRMKAEEGGS